jgi:type III secretion protein J
VKDKAARVARASVVLACLWALGCTSEVYHGLGEQEANEIIVVLEQRGIEASKEADPEGEGLWVVKAPEHARVEAWRVLESEGLPRPAVRGVGEVYPSGGLIPTESEERALLQYTTAQELRRGLLKLDGVVDAHINLVLPKRARVQLPGTVPPKPRASVVLRYKAGAEGAAPVTEDEVRQLVSWGVEDMEPESVAVVMKAEARSLAPLKPAELAQVGPIAVSSGTKGWLQGLIAGLCVVILVLGGLLAFFLTRRSPTAVAAAE